ncbi:hypothetical protein [Plantactinospora sp. B24E8]|uniref:DUF2207 family protein n=1 Tax=Plantactinospora sp. B24E8 TaxID=3153567 RepID=UPI00325D37B3
MRTIDWAVEVGLPVIGLAGWTVAYWIARLVTRPRYDAPGAPASAPPGPESPAVVNLLVSRWQGTSDAARATLLDLAARGHLVLRQPGPDPRATTVQPTGQPSDGLSRPERLVLSRVAERAAGGQVPLAALGFHDVNRSAAWSKAFRRAVVAEARQLGLSRRRFPKRLVTALGVLGGVAALAVTVGFVHHLVGTGDLADRNGDHIVGGIAAFLVTTTVLVSVTGRDLGERDTPAGRAAAARWRGFGSWLAGQGALAEVPPVAVGQWHRHLSYGAAFGLARLASRLIELGMADRERLWSSYGGAWRQVWVSYPGRTLLHGQSLGWLGFRAVCAGVLGGSLVGVPGRLWFGDALASGGYATLWEAADPILLGFVLFGLAALGYAAYVAVRVVIALVAPVDVSGEVIWHQVWQYAVRDDGPNRPVNHHLVVDDGHSARLRAWVLPQELADRCRLGDVVTVRVRPWTRRVRDVTVLRAARSGPTSPSAGPEWAAWI